MEDLDRVAVRDPDDAAGEVRCVRDSECLKILSLGIAQTQAEWAIPLSFLPDAWVNLLLLFVALSRYSRLFVGLSNTYLTLH